MYSFGRSRRFVLPMYNYAVTLKFQNRVKSVRREASSNFAGLPWGIADNRKCLITRKILLFPLTPPVLEAVKEDP
jgi:hypothetical protein